MKIPILKNGTKSWKATDGSNPSPQWIYTQMVKLANTLASETSSEKIESSSLSFGTKVIKNSLIIIIDIDKFSNIVIVIIYVGLNSNI